jgi:hypothetical protein
MATVRDWLYWRLMRDFGVRGCGEYIDDKGRVFWDGSTAQFYEWTKMTNAGWTGKGTTSCTSFLWWVHRHIVDEGGFKPTEGWKELPKLKAYRTGTIGAQCCDFFQLYPNHVGVLLDISGNVAEYLAGGWEDQTRRRIAWTREYVPPPGKQFLGYLDIETYYTGDNEE